MEALSNFLISTGIGDYVAAHDWVWPLCETLHFFGMSVLLGTVGVVDLRVLGVAKGIPIQLLDKFIPLGVIAMPCGLIRNRLPLDFSEPAISLPSGPVTTLSVAAWAFGSLNSTALPAPTEKLSQRSTARCDCCRMSSRLPAGAPMTASPRRCGSACRRCRRGSTR